MSNGYLIDTNVLSELMREKPDPIDIPDAQIAAIALAANLMLMTRNTKDFEGIDGLQVINPWQLH